jgi:AbrB family looped-hinge helix DNA binding protein
MILGAPPPATYRVADHPAAYKPPTLSRPKSGSPQWFNRCARAASRSRNAVFQVSPPVLSQAENGCPVGRASRTFPDHCQTTWETDPMKLTADGQITIPEHIRRRAGLTPDSELEFRYENGRIWLEQVPADIEAKRRKILQAIQQVEGSATANLDLTTDDIMRMTRGED